MDTTLREQLLTTINEFLATGKAFSGYQITVATRKREKIQLRHNEVARSLNDLIEPYVISNRSKNTGWHLNHLTRYAVLWTKSKYWIDSKLWFWVYHPVEFSMNDFELETENPSKNILETVYSTVAPVHYQLQNAISSLPVTKTVKFSSDEVYHVDYRNRLMVPRKFLRNIGLSAGQLVYIYYNPGTGTLELSKSTPNSNTAFVQKIERNGNIRLSSKVLSAISNRGSKTRFSITHDEVIKIQ